MFQRFYSVLTTALILFCGCLTTSGWAQMLNPEDVMSLRQARQVVIQPQGNYIAYSLAVHRDADEKPGSSYSELWVTDIRRGDSRPYIRKPASVSSISWTPDGKLILFRAKRKLQSKYTQVYAMPVDGGEPYAVTDADRNISAYALSPDGSEIAYILRDEAPEEVKMARKQGFDQKVIDTWSSVNRIHRVPFGGGEAQVVNNGVEHVLEFAWSPSGQEIVYRATERPFVDDSYMLSDNYVVSASGGDSKKLYDTEGKLDLALISPDGSHAAWLGATTFNDPANGSLFLLKRDGSSPRNLMVDFPGTAESFIWKDKSKIILNVVENTGKVVYEVAVPSGKMKPVLKPGTAIPGAISLASDGRTFATAASSPMHPAEVFSGGLKSGKMKRLTNSNPILNDMPLGKQETIAWKGPDDLTIYGVLVKPVGYESGKRYPLQVQVHGGPEAARLNTWYTGYNRPIQLLAQRGIMVLIPNYRASTGRGVAFSKLNHRDPMGKEFDDILAGVDYLVDEGMVDPAKVAIGGGSYGGYAAAWGATKHSDRFAAAVMFVGIANQISKGGLTDTPLENAVVHWDMKMHDNMDFVWDRSPLKYIQNAKTPTLILHGEEDRRVPVNQAYEMYRGLKHMDVPTELVIYPREGHGNRERAHQLDLLQRVLGWYEQYLKTAPSAQLP